jgi:hypothetical protein
MNAEVQLFLMVAFIRKAETFASASELANTIRLSGP